MPKTAPAHPQSAAAISSSTTTQRIPRFKLTPAALTVVLSLVAIGAVVLFMTFDLKGNLGYIVPRRAIKVSAMVLAAVAVGVSTLLFQTVTNNKILTPSIMGFDALYVLLQTVLVFTLGGTAWVTVPESFKFVIEMVLMVVFAGLLYRWLFTGGNRSLHLMLLIGIVFATLFRGVSALLQRLMEPSEYIILQDLFFASFNQVDPGVLGLAGVVVAVASFFAWRMKSTLDVVSLGRDTCISLGVNHRSVVTRVLVICTVLVAASTALVGPVTFFGLLVVSLGYIICRSYKHVWLLPIVCLLGIIALVGGQFLLENIFGFSTALSIVIEFVGGILFIALLLKGSLK
ncbi:iron chelate uptake ABC transporter family permease subunit [Neomicrococcus aestuarii]|uniref:Iron complex transport system permease protein n=1 Tax=Neomicrococcus aestuarii TaxID=556325 RepID=A0A7W8TUM7_9MICC|nr:iron chelate uptake ABC transporter family permease subunit [Neomicrococcus aestuarii]MBB5513210.1 iron complex transport system permease protein [Neomicrococcus aestuarii]